MCAYGNPQESCTSMYTITSKSSSGRIDLYLLIDVFVEFIKITTNTQILPETQCVVHHLYVLQCIDYTISRYWKYIVAEV